VSLIALFSDKGSPGVTTSALALASVWPRRVALAELDPAGGDLALRLTDPAGRPILMPEPSLLTLASAARAAGAVPVWDHAQPFAPTAGGAVFVVPGLATAEQGAGMTTLWPAVADALAQTHGGDVLADLGRLQHGSPTVAVAEHADVLVGVGRATPDGMLRLRDRMTNLLAALPASGPARRATVILVGDDRHADETIAAMAVVLAKAGLPVEVAGFIAHDRGAVTDLQHGRITARTQRSLLLRTARAIVPGLAGRDGLVRDSGVTRTVRRTAAAR
jgi:hypothetical protein